MAELTELFRVENVNKAASRFDFEKLAWLNQHYLKTDDPLEIVRHLLWHLRNEGIAPDAGPDQADVVVALRDRVKTLKDMAERARVWYLGIEQWDQSAVSKHLLPAGDVLRQVRTRLAALDEWSPAAIDAVLRETAETLGLGLGKVAQPLRVATTGGQVSPSIDHTIFLCSQEGALARLDRALDIVESGMLPG